MLLAGPEVIIDEPTPGIDIRTRQQIDTLIARQAAEGHSIIVIASEMPDLIGIASRVVVMHAPNCGRGSGRGGEQGRLRAARDGG